MSGDTAVLGVAIDSSADAYITGSTTGTIVTTGGACQTSSRLHRNRPSRPSSTPRPPRSTMAPTSAAAAAARGPAIALANGNAGHRRRLHQQQHLPDRLPRAGQLRRRQRRRLFDPVQQHGQLPRSTAPYFGGSGTDVATAVAVNSQNQVLFTGYTSSSNFPQVNSGQSYGGSQDAFVAEVSPLPPTPVITAITPGTQIASDNYVSDYWELYHFRDGGGLQHRHDLSHRLGHRAWARPASAARAPGASPIPPSLSARQLRLPGHRHQRQLHQQPQHPVRGLG